MLIHLLTISFLIPLGFAEPVYVNPVPTPAPTPLSVVDTQDIVERCNDGDCTYGGTAATLTANTVTTTIVSTTSVPCYITTYVTDSKTTTATVYSTDVITSTVTEAGTVTVIEYQPTPILKSSVYTSVIAFTQTATSWWTENQGSAHKETVTGPVQTIGGGTNGGGNGPSKQGQGGWTTPAATVPAAGKTVVMSTAPPTGSAWTHVNAAADMQGVKTIDANGMPVAAAGGGDGWNAAPGAYGPGPNPGTTVTAAGMRVHWNGSGLTRHDASSLLIVLAAAGTILVFEVCRFVW